MQPRATVCILCIALVATACSSASIAEPAGDAGTLSFQAGGQAFVVSGNPAGVGAQLLASSFAAAYADSLSGVVVTGFRRTGDDVGDLLVLQAPRATGTFECAPAASPCDTRGASLHGRFITGVHNLSTTEAQRYYHLVSGTLQVTQVGADRFRATFNGVLEAGDDPQVRLTVENGTIDVPYAGAPQVIALLQCLRGSSGAQCD